jgi:DNA-binding NtrC family response regulator
LAKILTRILQLSSAGLRFPGHVGPAWLEAISILQARSAIQAVITDVEMPGPLNGCDLTRAVPQRWPGVWVIATSGRAQPPADDWPENVPFITKPYLPNTIGELVRRLAKPQVLDLEAGVMSQPQGRIPLGIAAVLMLLTRGNHQMTLDQSRLFHVGLTRQTHGGEWLTPPRATPDAKARPPW